MYKNIIIENINICNLRCMMCPSITLPQNEKGVMKDSVFENILTCLNGQVEWVFVTGGGEPFLDKKIFQRIKKLKEKGVNVGTTTHGGLLDNKKIHEIIKSGLDFIHFSFDGATKEMYEAIRIHSRYEDVLKNIKKLAGFRKKMRSSLRIGANFVIMKKTLYEMLPFAKLMFSLGVDCVEFIGMLPIAPYAELKTERCTDREMLEAVKKVKEKLVGKEIITFNIEKKKLKNNCFADAISTVFISWEGNVSPCGYLCRPVIWIEDGNIPQPGKIIGNVLKESLSEIWKKQEYITFRNIIQSGSVPKLCRYCDLIYSETDSETNMNRHAREQQYVCK